MFLRARDSSDRACSSDESQSVLSRLEGTATGLRRLVDAGDEEVVARGAAAARGCHGPEEEEDSDESLSSADGGALVRGLRGLEARGGGRGGGAGLRCLLDGVSPRRDDGGGGGGGREALTSYVGDEVPVSFIIDDGRRFLVLLLSFLLSSESLGGGHFTWGLRLIAGCLVSSSLSSSVPS